MPLRRSPLRRLVVIAAALALSACYASHRLLLDPEAAAHPLADGVYQRQGDAHDRFRLTLEPDGWYRIEPVAADGTLGEGHRVLVNREGDSFILAQAADEGFVYAVAQLHAGRVYLATPDCADPLDRGWALDQGAAAEEDGPMTHACLFKSRQALVAALGDFAGHADFGAPYLPLN